MNAHQSSTGSTSPQDGDLNLGTLPKSRLDRRLRRWLLTAVITQAIFAAGVLFALQLPWGARHSSEGAIARVAADRLSAEVMHAANPRAKQALDGIVSLPGMRFGVIVDSSDTVVLASGAAALSAPSIDELVGYRLPTSLSAESVSHFREVRSAVPIGRDGEYRLILAMTDPNGSRALVDGGLALVLGLLGTLVVLVPLSMLHIRRSAGGLHELHKAIRRLAKGVPPDPVAAGGDDEVAYLTIAFNSMAADIVATQRALQDANAGLEQRVSERTNELRIANEALARNNQALEEVTQNALRFTDDVAHDFRTPLAVILEFASLIQDGFAGAVTEKQSEHLGFIIEAGRDLSGLVDDFLDTSRLRAGRLPVQRKRHTVDELLDSTWTMLQVKAQSRQVRLRRASAPGLPAVFIDLDKAKRILINLVVNAIKFSRAGDEVVVEACPCEDGVSIRVCDHGPGMSESELAILFDRFRQTAAGQRSASKGFGLGLSITAEMVALNLGTLSVQSAVKKGSKFSFSMPSDDPASVVRMFLARAAERDPSSRIAALEISRPRAEETLDEIVELLGPRDVCLPLAAGGGVVLIGATDSAEAWRDRLLATPSIDDRAEPLVIDVLWTRSIAEVSPAELAALVTTIQEPVHV